MADTNPPLSALLIGIDRYTPPESGTQISYGNLGCCVRDVERVAAFLTDELGVTEERIRRLTAPLGGGEAPENSPTAANIVTAWRQLGDAAAPGEQVWIHYSGHGGRVPTSCLELKGEGGLDEVIVPTDIGDPRASYLRDTEIAILLREMTDAGLLVTLVLDSCHSGGAARGGGATRRTRGTGQIDRTPRPTHTLVAPPAELARNWREFTGRQARDTHVEINWLPAPRGYVLLAACRAQEQAYEDTWSGGEKGGALTHWLLDTARRWSIGYTWEDLHSQVRSRVMGELENQTPQLEGDRERVVFGSEERAAVAAVDVLRIDGERLLLHTGQAQGVRRGARFAIYPPRTADLRDDAGRLAMVEVHEPQATKSWAKVVERLSEEAIEVGAQAVLVEVAARSACRVFLPSGPGDAIRRALEEDGRGFVVMAARPTEADFVVDAENGEWVIRTVDAAAITGQEPRPRQNVDGAAVMAQRLVHLAKFRNVRRLANHNASSPLRGKLRLTLHRLSEDYDSSERVEPLLDLLLLETSDNVVEVTLGDRLCLELANVSNQTLNVVLLDLQPCWGIDKIYPSKAFGAFLPFDSGQREFLPLRADLPDGVTAGSDVLKAFATVDAVPFEWLELPPLEKAHRGARAVKVEEGSAGYDWTSDEVEIRVVRR